MRTANTDFAAAVARDDVAAALAADDRLHGVIIHAAHNPQLARLIAQIEPQVHRIYYRKFATLLGGRDTIEHHATLIQLCASADSDEAARVSAEHRRHLGGLIGDLFDSEELLTAS